jgi:ATP adenylyltransferase
MEQLWSPWRMKYLRQAEESAGQPGESPACIFCQKPAQDQDDDNLIIWRGERAYVILNLYPYNNGHVMVVPYVHTPTIETLDPETLTEIMLLVNQGVAALRSLYQPQAFNVGINLGAAAGAGIQDHVHVHVVPRWAGDTNFMTILANTRVIPEDLRETCQLLRQAWPR